MGYRGWGMANPQTFRQKKPTIICWIILLIGGCLLSVCSAACAMDWVEVSADKTHFVGKQSGKPVLFWGANYDHDAQMRLLDDYWIAEWDTVVADFDEMKALGLNVVRIHLQIGRFMDSPTQANTEALAKLAKLIHVAESRGLYLYVTGLACYKKANIPAWYDALDEDGRWAAQAVFWKHVARVCAASPAVFCYDLMNEPVVPGEAREDWLAPEGLGDFFYVQNITRTPDGRTAQGIAKAWVDHLVTAIRSEDTRHLITVGVIPWAIVWPDAKPLFYDPTVGENLDFASVHFYPEAGQVEKALTALNVYAVGKPLVVAEMFPLKCSVEEMDRFIDGSKSVAQGWLGFYWGKTAAEYASMASPTVGDRMMQQWLEYVQTKRPDAPKEKESGTLHPVLILIIGVTVVVVMVLVLRANAFLALICAALVVSLLAGGDWAVKGERVGMALGDSVGKIGIVIAMAAIIGVCMMRSGAAEKIVVSFCRVLGEKRFPLALGGSGFVLSVPVFYDTVFFLLIPLARSFYRRVGKNYILCLMAICAGAMITHTMVPPTPGPLAIATNLGIEIGQMMLVGLLVGVFLFPVGIGAAYLIEWYMPHPEIHLPAGEAEAENAQPDETRLPPLRWALLPVLLPIVLIAAGSYVSMAYKAFPAGTLPAWATAVKIVGGKEIAMMLAAALAMFVYYRQKIATALEMRKDVEAALLDAGLIILITAAGGAFGAMLQLAGIGGAIESVFRSESGVAGVSVLLAAFCVASVLKLSLGSSTTAMLTASSIIGAMGLTTEALGFNLAYLGLTISCGSLVTSWMNDSGFWMTSRMAGLSETDTLKSVTVLHMIVGCGGFAIILVLSQMLPLMHFGK